MSSEISKSPLKSYFFAFIGWQ